MNLSPHSQANYPGYQAAPAQLCAMLRGVEREGLRVLGQDTPEQAAASLALTPHPKALGSALTHPCITTDFSEAQLELITSTHSSAEDCEAELRQIHQAVHHVLRQQSPAELLWANSMACILPKEEDIPIAHFGSSFIGQAKSVYRQGLSRRYGRRMQTISGLHYNWSMPGLGTTEYLALIRNFRRESWLLLYLFGASPAVDEGFVSGRIHPLEAIGPRTLGLPYATSLRMGRLGYQSAAQDSINASFNCLESYAASLEKALTAPYPAYEAIGLQDAQGRYQQLATTLLQIENEFYSTIRPKRVVQSGERPLRALRERGIQYIEVRCMDLNPLSPIGIDAATMRFLDLFLLRCLRRASPLDSPEEQALMSANQVLVAHEGRKPGLNLHTSEGGQRALSDWAQEIVEDCAQMARELDTCYCKPGRVRDETRSYGVAVQAVQACLDNPAQLPSSQILGQLEQEKASFAELTLAQSQAHAIHWAHQVMSAEQDIHFQELAQASLKAQLDMENQEKDAMKGGFIDFEAFRQHYIQQPFNVQ